MGTKNNPGQYDCYAKLEPDEPFLTLRGKDPVAPYLTEIWAASRTGDMGKILDLVEEMSRDPGVIKRVSSDSYEKLGEALKCAQSMRLWRAEKEAANAKGGS